MNINQKYDIKFPFQTKSLLNTFVDLNITEMDSIKSQIMHLLFTPVGQRLRKPLFGSKLIQYIFNPNDTQTWDDVVSEIKTMISMYIPNCSLTKINVYETDNGLGLMAEIGFSITKGDSTISDTIITKL